MKAEKSVRDKIKDESGHAAQGEKQDNKEASEGHNGGTSVHKVSEDVQYLCKVVELHRKKAGGLVVLGQLVVQITGDVSSSIATSGGLSAGR